MSKSSKWLRLGRVLRPRGLSGEVYLYLYADPEDLPEEIPVFVSLSPHLMRPLTLVALYPHRGRVFRARFREVLDRTAAGVLTGQDLFVDPGVLRALPDSLYSYELVGMEVVDEAGVPRGVVEEVYLYPAQDVLEIRYGRRLYLLPLVQAFIRGIDRDRGRIVVRIPDGLLEDV